MFKNKFFYKSWAVIYLILILPNMMFQMRGEKRSFQEEPLLFFGATLIGALLCAIVFYALFKNPKTENN